MISRRIFSFRPSMAGNSSVWWRPSFGQLGANWPRNRPPSQQDKLLEFDHVSGNVSLNPRDATSTRSLKRSISREPSVNIGVRRDRGQVPACDPVRISAAFMGIADGKPVGLSLTYNEFPPRWAQG